MTHAAQTSSAHDAQMLTALASGYRPGDTDLSWTRATSWRSVLAATLAPAGLTLDAEIACSAPRGQRFQLAVQLPPAPWRLSRSARR